MDDPFLQWWVPWLAARPDGSPIGWYTKDDLEAAFNAGKDDRPGRPVSPPKDAGPVPKRDWFPGDAWDEAEVPEQD